MRKILIAIILSFVIAFVVAFAIAAQRNIGTTTVAQESVYDRVMRTGTLRCGYFEEAPFTIVDPNTGKKSGFAVELAEKIAKELGLKVEWSAEAKFGTLIEDLRIGRYDAVCASLFTLPRAGRIDFTVPYTYVPIYAFTQAGRTEFDNKLDQLDWSQLSISGLDGESATTIALERFPQAKFVLLPQNAQIAEVLTNVADKKADIAFVLPTVFGSFDKNNPHRLQKISADKPFYVFNVSFGIKPNEPAFKDMLDFSMRNLASNGYLQSLFQKYDPDNLLYRPASLYKTAQY